MIGQTDPQLLRAYAASRSEAAFAELVRRHVDFVYSAALRMVCDPHLAEDVTQGTFVALAKSASQLADRPVLSGWLHRTAQNIAAQTVRTIERRRAREQEAVAMNQLLSAEPDATWEQIAPELDAALGELNEPDRDALLLRYFENKSAREMALALGISDEAAQKRVSRALERLREFFTKRGLTVGASGLVVVISANAVQAAPVGLAASISTAVAALAGTMIAATATATATKAITMTTLHKTIIGAALAAVVGAGIYEAGQTARLRGQVQALQQQQGPLVEQIAQLKSDNEGLSNRLAQAKASVSSSSDRLRELLRLRGEVALLRRQNGELERAVTAQSKTREVPGQPAVGGIPQPARPLPFQLQLVLDQPGDNSEAITNHASAGETLYVQKTPLLDYTAVRSATITKNASSGAPEINVEFGPEGKELFAAITKENISRRLAIVLDGHLYSAPVIRSEISGGQAQITGSFTEEEAKELVAKINEAAIGDVQAKPR